jgi:trehalose monomycolate/heme transporter
VALASLMLFPMTFLRSMGYGGVATVLVDMLAALTVMPALLSVLGPRVNALRVRPRRRARAAGQPALAQQSGLAPQPALAQQGRAALADETSGAWYRLARSVMRRPVVYVVVIVAGLAAVGSPFLHITWGGTDAQVLPAAAAPRVVTVALNRDFPGNVTNPIEAVVQFPGPASAAGRGGELPVKAIVMNAASLSATFGIVVWIFQDGHLSGLLHFTPTGTI